jgi:hypothetical protein
VIHNDGNRLYAALLLGAGLAVILVAALTAWAAHLGGAAWPPVLVPFAAVLAVPMTALAWPRHADGNDRTNDAEASVRRSAEATSRSHTRRRTAWRRPPARPHDHHQPSRLHAARNLVIERTCWSLS